MIQKILKTWFKDLKANDKVSDEHMALWFQKNEDVDRQLKENFEKTLTKAKNGEHEDWKQTAEGRLAWIILLDQFSRNIYRNSPKSWEADSLTQKACVEGLQNNDDQKLMPIQRVFFYMPLEHAENKELQALSVKKFTKLVDDVSPNQKEQFENFLDYAVQHKNIVDRFGRFPHRNQILNRSSTSEEIEFLKQPGSSF